jgi:hypothetical protein
MRQLKLSSAKLLDPIRTSDHFKFREDSGIGSPTSGQARSQLK